MVSLRLDSAPPARGAEPHQADLPLPARPLPRQQTLPIPEALIQAGAPPVAAPPAEAPLQAAPAIAAEPVPIQAGPAAVTGVATVAPPPAAPRTRKEVAASAVSYLVLPPVEVPTLSRRARESGTVWLRVVVDVRGLPIEVRLLRSSGHPRLDEQALWAMRQARFRPHTEDGLAVEVAVTAPIEYALD
ncbi:MAG: energy transducer TonB [Rubrivivax sp.]|nr:energy transducer TonB [Rubrivivax sp.]